MGRIGERINILPQEPAKRPENPYANAVYYRRHLRLLPQANSISAMLLHGCAARLTAQRLYQGSRRFDLSVCTRKSCWPAAHPKQKCRPIPPFALSRRWGVRSLESSPLGLVSFCFGLRYRFGLRWRLGKGNRSTICDLSKGEQALLPESLQPVLQAIASTTA